MNIAYSISMCVMQSRQGLEKIVKEMALICNLQENSMFTTSMGYWGRSHVKEEMERGQRRGRGDGRNKRNWTEWLRQTQSSSKMTWQRAETADAPQQTRETVHAKVGSLEHLIRRRSSPAKPTHETKRKSTETWISTKALTNSTNQWTHCAYKFCNWEEMIISFWKIWTAKIHLRKVQWTYKENKPAVRNHSKTGSTTLCWALSKCSETFTRTQNKVPPKDNLS